MRRYVSRLWFAIWGFVTLALKPVTDINNWWNAGIIVVTYATPRLLPWWKGASAVTQGLVYVGITAFLFLVAGVKLEHRKRLRDEVSFVIETPDLFPLPHDQREKQTSIRVLNQGAPGVFRASLSSDVEGIDVPRYGRGTVLAWEGHSEKVVELGRCDTATLRVSVYDDAFPKLRFFIPPSPDTGSTYGIGLLLTPMSRRITYRLTVRETRTDVAHTAEITMTLDDQKRLLSVTKIDVENRDPRC
jgi:hypothetical protein